MPRTCEGADGAAWKAGCSVVSGVAQPACASLILAYERAMTLSARRIERPQFLTSG